MTFPEKVRKVLRSSISVSRKELSKEMDVDKERKFPGKLLPPFYKYVRSEAIEWRERGSEDMEALKGLARNLFGMVIGSVVETGGHAQDNADQIQNPRPSAPSPPDQASEADGQGAVDGTRPEATVEVDVELGEGGQIRSQQAPSTTSVQASVPDDGGGPTANSQSRTVKGNLMIGFALLSPSCTSLLKAGSLSHALYMGLTSLGILVSLVLSYAGDDGNSKVHKALLMVSTTAIVSALSMLGVAEFF